MLRLDKQVDDILLLKKQIKYELSHKGGANKTKNFVENTVNRNKEFIGLSFYICFTIIIYIILYQNKSLKQNSIIPIKNIKYMIGGNNNTISKIISFVINTIIKIKIFIIAQPLLIIYSFGSIILLIIILFLILIIDFGLYVPCGGCQKNSRYIKCMPGTGEGSLTCNALKGIYKVLKSINKLLKKLKRQIVIVKNKIKEGLYVLRDISIIVKRFIVSIFGFPLRKLKEFFGFLRYLDISKKWGINLGKLLLGGDTKIVIYHLNGKLRDKHGRNAFFRVFFKIIRIILETPNVPKLTWPSFGGAEWDSKREEPKYIDNTDIIITNDNDIKKPYAPIPNKNDYNKYYVNIITNQVSSTKENANIRLSNLKKEQIAERNKLKKENSIRELKQNYDKEMQKISGKDNKINKIKKDIEEINNNIDKLVAKGKKILDDINRVHKPHFIKIAKIGEIQNDGETDPAEIRLENGVYVLINIWKEDLTKEQLDSFNRLNQNMITLNLNTEKLDEEKIKLLTAMDKLEETNNLIGDYNNGIKDYLYMKFLEGLIKVDMNPLVYIVKFFNLLIKLLNIAINEAIIKPTIKLIKLIFKLAKKINNALLGELKKIGKYVLIPIYKMFDAFKPILKVFYKVTYFIKNIGIFNMIFYYFYDKIETAFSFLKPKFNLKIPKFDLKMPKFDLKMPTIDMPDYEIKMSEYRLKLSQYKLEKRNYLLKLSEYKLQNKNYLFKKREYELKQKDTNIFLLLFITIVICAILVICPIIGGFYEIYLFFRSIIKLIILIVYDIGVPKLSELFKYIQEIGPLITDVYLIIFSSIVNFISNFSNNISNIVSNIGTFAATIIILGIISIILIIIYLIYFISKNNLITKFIVGNTTQLQNNIYNKQNNKKKKNKT